MTRKLFLGILLSTVSVLLLAQSSGNGSEGKIIINAGDTKWEPANAGSESITLREDSKTGATELLARYPSGHVFPAHWHDANERLVLIEGQIAMDAAGGRKILEAGGYAYLPAHQIQRMSCVSNTRCSFYVSWDGSPKSHAADK